MSDMQLNPNYTRRGAIYLVPNASGQKSASQVKLQLAIMF